jgi:hypothetical protein
MKKIISLFKVMSVVLILVLVLSACGGAAGPKAEAQNPTAEPQSAPAVENTAEPASEPSATAAASSDNTAVPATPENTSEPQASPAAQTDDAKNLVSDLGFRPDTNGFNFENYGSDNGAKDLTEVEVQRMFGDQVCALKKDGQCVLNPTAQQWMEQTNKDMAGGHCEGFAALSLLMYANQVKSTTFGGPDAHELPFSNEALQREIAYWWATQVVNPTSGGVINGTPNDILDVLKKMTPGGETYTIGIYKRDGSGGHAITPFAVADDGNGTFSVLVYDNNYPNTTRKLMIDSNKNTWTYEASINPQTQSELYEGDADTKTLSLTPTSVRLNQQACPFCADAGSARVGNSLAAPAESYNQIFLDGEGHLLIQDGQGNKLGYVDGKLLNNIPGAKFVNIKVASATTDSPEPVYQLPAGMDVEATIDGSTLKNESSTDLVMIGKGFSVGVEGIKLDPKQKDTVNFMPKDQAIVYDTDSAESPNFVVTVEQPGGNDYDFEVQGTGMNGGGTITVSLDTKKGDLLINTEKLKNEGKFSFSMTRYTDTDEETYTADDIALKAGAVVYVNYAEWKGNGKGLTFGVDNNGDGTIDDEYSLDDSK